MSNPFESLNKPDPQPKKRAKPRASQTLVIGLLVGGSLLVFLLCCVGGISGYLMFFSGPTVAGPTIVGKWELVEEQDRRTWEFNRGGTGKLRIHKEFKGKVEDSTGFFDYKLIDGNPPTLEMKLTRVEGAVTDRMQEDIGQTFRFKVAQEGDSLQLTKFAKQRSADTLSLKRVR
jgi:hypothetical protein